MPPPPTSLQPPPPSPASPTPSLPSSPASLPEELIEEILLRFPPGEPASLFRAAVVCKPWCRLISGSRFRRKFRELHRTPPMLGFLCNNGYECSCFVPTTAFRPPPDSYSFDWAALDARHGRVLFQKYLSERRGYDLMVWDPITDEQRVLPIMPRPTQSFTAAVLCARTGDGVCHHLDCHRGPFLVVFAGEGPCERFVCTYSSDVDAWSEPISTPQLDIFEDFKQRTVLLGNAIYFVTESTEITLMKYNLESHEMSSIQLPNECNDYWRHHELTTMEEGLLGLVTIFDSELSMWLRKGPPEVDAGWTKIRIIDLKTVLPLDSVVTSPRVVGFADGPGILFVKVENDLYTIDLKTYKVEFYQSDGDICIVPYMSFYTPELEVACTDDEPSAGGSNA